MINKDNLRLAIEDKIWKRFEIVKADGFIIETDRDIEECWNKVADLVIEDIEGNFTDFLFDYDLPNDITIEQVKSGIDLYLS